MAATVRDAMDTCFVYVHPETPVLEAVRIFKKASRELDRKIFGMIVVNEKGELVGMISMYDILILMRPKYIHIWGEMNDIDAAEFISEALSRVRSLLVGDLMTTEVISVTPDTHLLLIVDLMTRKHMRRIPVVENGKVIGIVHISNVLFHLMGMDTDAAEENLVRN